MSDDAHLLTDSQILGLFSDIRDSLAIISKALTSHKAYLLTHTEALESYKTAIEGLTAALATHKDHIELLHKKLDARNNTICQN